jgi:DNA repair ATPase RecN
MSANESDYTAALQEIVDQVERLYTDYNAALGEVREHQEQMAKDRAALAKLRIRLMDMRESVRGLDDDVWKLPWDHVPRTTREKALDVIRTLTRLLDDVVWQLFEFREPVKSGSEGKS